MSRTILAKYTKTNEGGPDVDHCLGGLFVTMVTHVLAPTQTDHYQYKDDQVSGDDDANRQGETVVERVQ